MNVRRKLEAQFSKHSESLDLNDDERARLVRAHFLETFDGESGASLAALYDCALANHLSSSKQGRQRTGSFYTPADLVTRILDLVVEPFFDSVVAKQGWEGLSNLRIVDPSCGTGQFLVPLVERLVIRIGEARSGHPRGIVVGVDTDEIALTICRQRLEEVGGYRFELRKGDALLDGLLADRSWDLVIGNPPFGLSRNSKISAEDLVRLRQQFEPWISGKPNKFLLFMALACELLSDGGIATLVTPDSWLGIRDAGLLRTRVAENYRLTELHRFPGKRYFSAGVEVVVPVIKRSAPCEEVSIFEHGDAAPETRVVRWQRTRGYLLATELDSASSMLISELQREGVLLGASESRFRPAIALQLYAVGKGTPPQTDSTGRDRAFHRSSREAENDYPYIEGREVGRYVVPTPDQFVRYGPWVAEFQPIERFRRPRILIREVLAPLPHRIRAAFVDFPALYNKSVLHILSRGASDADLRALTCVLNSQIASLYIQLMGRKARRKLFPKLLQDDLAQFPLPRYFDAHVERLSAVFEQLVGTPEDPELNAAAEEAVGAAYGLDVHVAEAIKRRMGTFVA